MAADPGFHDFYQREFRAVFRALFLLCGDPNIAEDATQEAFVRALERWDRLGGQPWAGGWAMSTAINLGKRALRRRSTERPLASDTPDVDAAVDLWRAVAKLPLRQQQVVVLYYGEDLSVRDIARAIGCREGTVRAHLARARATLEIELRGETDAAGRTVSGAD